jgi:hypothetical protein
MQILHPFAASIQQYLEAISDPKLTPNTGVSAATSRAVLGSSHLYY